MPPAVAVNVVIPDVPPMFSVPVAALVNPPVPDSAVPTVRVPLLVSVTPVTVTFGIENVPLSAWLLVSKVCTPVPALKLPLLVIPPRKLTAELIVSFQVAPEFTVTKPLKLFVPAVEEKVRLPLVPPPTVVVPVTVKL